jgi:hypothetical protein
MNGTAVSPKRPHQETAKLSAASALLRKKWRQKQKNGIIRSSAETLRAVVRRRERSVSLSSGAFCEEAKHGHAVRAF